MRARADRIKIGIVGLNFGRSILDQLTAGEAGRWFEVAAVCDLEVRKARLQAARFKCRAYARLEDMLEERELPAIGLFTGPVGRAKLIRQIIRAGKDVITTKPFELDPDAALKVLHEARQLKRVVHLNSPSPLLTPDLQQVQVWRKKYRLGNPVGCRMDVWASYRERADNTWYDDPAMCPAAPVFRLGIYLINDLVRLLGEAKRVTVLESGLFTKRPTADNAQLGIIFANGALANIYASFCVNDGDFYRNSMTLNFERGTIYRNVGPTRRAGVGESELALVMVKNKQRRIIEEVVLTGKSGQYQWDVFHRAVRGERLENEVTSEQIVAGIQIVRAMAEATRRSGIAEVKK